MTLLGTIDMNAMTVMTAAPVRALMGVHRATPPPARVMGAQRRLRVIDLCLRFHAHICFKWRREVEIADELPRAAGLSPKSPARPVSPAMSSQADCSSNQGMPKCPTMTCCTLVASWWARSVTRRVAEAIALARARMQDPARILQQRLEGP